MRGPTLFPFCMLLVAALVAGCGDHPAPAVLPPPSGIAVPPEAVDELELARAAAMEFGKELRARLTAAIEKGGAELAIDVCKTDAGTIAESHAQRLGGKVGRTGLRLRNPDNEPDDWDLAALESFAASVVAGRNPANLEKAEVVAAAGGGGRELRYAKAIATENACLVCHGDNIPPPVRAKLTLAYPDDRAVGFREGELRGAFTLRVPVR